MQKLAKRIAKLEDFFYSEKCGELDVKQQRIISARLHVMKDYIEGSRPYSGEQYDKR